MNRVAWSIVFLLVGVLYLPFVPQAFHVDDRIYLEIADNILRKPLFPYDYPAVFEGISAPDAASHSHLPLTSYYLAVLRVLSSAHREWVYHLAFLVFPLLAAWGIYDLARGRLRYPEVTAALLLASPAVVVLGHSLMPDVPLMAFWIVALGRVLRIVEGSGVARDWLIAGLSLLAASFISLVTAGLILLLAAALVLSWSARRGPVPWFRFGLLLAAPLLLWAVWYLLSYLHYDRFVLVNTLLHMNKRATFDWSLFGVKALSFVLNLGAVSIFPLALWYGFRGRFQTGLALLGLILGVVPFLTWVPGWQWKHILLFAVFFASGALVLSEFVRMLFIRDLLSRILSLWFFGIFAAALILYYSGSVRYVLLAIPPVLLVWQMRMEKGSCRPGRTPLRLLWCTAAITCLYALAPAYADFRMAESYRNAAAELVSRYESPGRNIWYTGEWGFRYYFEQQGARMIRRVDNLAKPGDLIIKPYLASPWVTLYDGPPYSSLLEQRAVSVRFPVRLLDFSSHAGFYSTGWGILPWSLDSGSHWEWFNIYRVDKAFEGPVPEEEQHW